MDSAQACACDTPAVSSRCIQLAHYCDGLRHSLKPESGIIDSCQRSADNFISDGPKTMLAYKTRDHCWVLVENSRCKYFLHILLSCGFASVLSQGPPTPHCTTVNGNLPHFPTRCLAWLRLTLPPRICTSGGVSTKVRSDIMGPDGSIFCVDCKVFFFFFSSACLCTCVHVYGVLVDHSVRGD